MHGKRLIFRVALLTIAAGLCGAAFFMSPAMAEEITLTFATNSPPTGLKGDAETIFIEELEKASGGKIKVKPFWAESLLNINEMLKGISDGVVDMGYVNVAYYPKRLIRNSGILTARPGTGHLRRQDQRLQKDLQRNPRGHRRVGRLRSEDHLHVHRVPGGLVLQHAGQEPGGDKKP